MARSHERGRRGEALAAEYLEGEGWTILDRNWRAGHSEIDLVIRKGTLVAFVEVKTRVGADGSDPLEGITGKKRAEVERAARRWIFERSDVRYITGEKEDATAKGSRLEERYESSVGRGGGMCEDPLITYRFDAVAVLLFGGSHAEVRHLPDAWWIGDG